MSPGWPITSWFRAFVAKQRANSKGDFNMMTADFIAIAVLASMIISLGACIITGVLQALAKRNLKTHILESHPELSTKFTENFLPVTHEELKKMPASFKWLRPFATLHSTKIFFFLFPEYLDLPPSAEVYRQKYIYWRRMMFRCTAVMFILYFSMFLILERNSHRRHQDLGTPFKFT